MDTRPGGGKPPEAALSYEQGQFDCNHYQGSLFGQPEPGGMFEQSLQEHKR